VRRVVACQFTAKSDQRCRRELPKWNRPGLEFFLDFWGFVGRVLHLGQQNVYFQSRCIVRVDLNRQRNTYRGRIPPGT